MPKKRLCTYLLFCSVFVEEILSHRHVMWSHKCCTRSKVSNLHHVSGEKNTITTIVSNNNKARSCSYQCQPTPPNSPPNKDLVIIKVKNSIQENNSGTRGGRPTEAPLSQNESMSAHQKHTRETVRSQAKTSVTLRSMSPVAPSSPTASSSNP